MKQGLSLRGRGKQRLMPAAKQIMFCGLLFYLHICYLYNSSFMYLIKSYKHTHTHTQGYTHQHPHKKYGLTDSTGTFMAPFQRPSQYKIADQL